MGRSLYNKKIGIIGYGKVGKRFAELIEPFSRDIYFYDPFVPGTTDSIAVKLESLPGLLRKCDIISIHIPLTSDNHYLIDSNYFKLLKDNSVILNTSRGLIDEDALYLFLKNNPNASAYLDIFEKETYTGKLTGLDNILLTSHIGTTTRETREVQRNRISGMRKSYKCIT